MSKLEQQFESHIKAIGLGGYQREYKFARDIVGHGAGIRKRLKDAGLKDWRFDFYWPDYFIAVEINGGTFINGRHNHGRSLNDEYRKINTAQEQGISVLVYDTDMVKSGEAVNQVERIIKATHHHMEELNFYDAQVVGSIQ